MNVKEVRGPRSRSGTKIKKWKNIRALAQKVPRGINWTDLETEALLAEFNFALTLETKALKKQANK